MARLVIDIEGPDMGRLADLLDDVVALLHSGCVGQQGTYDGHQVTFSLVDEQRQDPCST